MCRNQIIVPTYAIVSQDRPIEAAEMLLIIIMEQTNAVHTLLSSMSHNHNKCIAVGLLD